MRGWQICIVVLLVGCGKKVVKSEGFAGEVLTATKATLQGKVGALGPPSCGVLTPSRRSIKLVDDDFYLELSEDLNSGKPRVVTVEVQGQRFTNDKAGTSSELVVDNIGGRIIGALNADLVHETVGTFIEREDGQKVPAPMNRLSVRLNFNLQPCP